MRTLPEKKYFKIGEVADLVGVEPHVLRYWETQFPQVRPHKARSGHRLYRRREVETLLVIRELLHVQRFTIAGARQALRQPGGAQSLLPRFFDGSTPMPGANAASDTLGPSTLVPQHVDATAEDSVVTASGLGEIDGDGEGDGVDGDGHGALFGAPGADSAEGDVVEIEAEGLDHDELRDALEREAAESVRAPRGTRRDVVEVEVAPEPSRKPAVRAIERARPAASPARVSVNVNVRPDEAHARRRLLEDALKSAHAVIAVLDREDARDRAQA